jgi:para-nitrobenzyl esterase
MASVVATTNGPITGKQEGGVHLFRGVPYGRAERFARPKSPAPWSSPLACTELGLRSPQAPPAFVAAEGEEANPIVQYFVGGDPRDLGLPADRDGEDCLVLNVVTPNPDGGARPVMVYIHGGGFSSGSGFAVTLGARLVTEEDVVLVGVNHRLNVFGYLHLGDLDDAFAGSGNAGQLDLVLALEWVRDNIANFGGDPNNVTVFGESGGGMKIGTLMGMPEAVGLFHKAIIQSGSRLGALSRDDATLGTQRMLDHLGAKPADLLTLTADELYQASVLARVPASPVIDGTVLPRAPFEPDASPLAADVALLVGHCLDEMTLFTAGVSEEELAKRLLLSDHELGELRAAYDATFPELSDRRRLVRIAGDSAFGHAVHTQAERKAAQPAPVFKYVFSYVPPAMAGALGAFHTAELPLTMRIVRHPEMEPLSRTIAAAWAAFARTGNPTTSQLAWPPFDATARLTMVFDDAPHVESDPYGTIRRAWDGIPTGGLELLLGNA